MLYAYVGAIMKHWWFLLIGSFGSLPFWARAILSSKCQEKIDEYFNPSALRWLAIVCISASFTLANYLAWRDEHLKIGSLNEELNKERDNNTVRLTGELLQTTVFTPKIGSNDFDVLATISIKNSGADSVARGYRAKVSFNAQVFYPKIIHLPDGGFPATDSLSNRTTVYFPSDTIYEKTMIPIKRGEIKTGVLLFRLENAIKFIDIESAWILYFEDYLGKLYEIVGKPGHKSPVMYFPGAGGIPQKKKP